jgi:hypothetical protein
MVDGEQPAKRVRRSDTEKEAPLVARNGGSLEEKRSSEEGGAVGELARLRRPCVGVQIVGGDGGPVFKFGIWGPLADVERAPLFVQLFALDTLQGMGVAESVPLLRGALARLDELGVPAPARNHPPEDKTRCTFPVFGWYLNILADVADSFRRRCPLVWRLSAPELR